MKDEHSNVAEDMLESEPVTHQELESDNNDDQQVAGEALSVDDRTTEEPKTTHSIELECSHSDMQKTTEHCDRSQTDSLNIEPLNSDNYSSPLNEEANEMKLPYKLSIEEATKENLSDTLNSDLPTLSARSEHENEDSHYEELVTLDRKISDTIFSKPRIKNGLFFNKKIELGQMSNSRFSFAQSDDDEEHEYDEISRAIQEHLVKGSLREEKVVQNSPEQEFPEDDLILKPFLSDNTEQARISTDEQFGIITCLITPLNPSSYLGR